MLPAKFQLLTAAVIAYASASSGHELSHPDCTRPSPGVFEGACLVRAKGADLNMESPFPFLRWAACVQSKFGLPSGGYGDAVFFTDLRDEFEIEMNASLAALGDLLSAEDKDALAKEQRAWVQVRKMADAKRSKQKSPQGTMYMASAAIANLTSTEDRAIELACRVERMTGRYVGGQDRFTPNPAVHTDAAR